MEKLKVGVLGATGAVGQNYINLLRDHPWLDISFLAASKNSDTFQEAVSERGWFMPQDIPEHARNISVWEASDVDKAKSLCDFVFSALESDPAKNLELLYAQEGIPVVSNASAYRWDSFVPMLIPEINADHIAVIPRQKEVKGYEGFIVVKPNCSLQSYMTPLYALMQKDFTIDKVVVTTLQASSGAGWPGVPSLDLIDNIVPYIPKEEDKSEQEPYKILGTVGENGIENYSGLSISATCTRVPVRDGHTASVNISFSNKKPSRQEIIEIWNSFRGLPQEYKLPSAPEQPIIYREEDNRPQPILDRDADKGMAVTVGKLRECPVFDYKFVALSHNTIRGAAGGGILNAELLVKDGYLQNRLK
ncbi:aspartate-semialdehyde dehydrogenase [Candidatus Woesearchaeota archaeon]|jgi:aspartate-semialdehyde dehydrogenase|nr:aspartate-semialdehyde dehydrogenase [Candidatus Woesearchaeota archaeon]